MRINKFSEPVSQTSKHVVAVSCRLVGAEVTRISRGGSLTRYRRRMIRATCGKSDEEDGEGEGGDSRDREATPFSLRDIDFPLLHFRFAEFPPKFHRNDRSPRVPVVTYMWGTNCGHNLSRLVFRNKPAPIRVKSNNSRDSLSAYPGLMRNFPNSNAAFLITVHAHLRQFSRVPCRRRDFAARLPSS